jgi:hypothetical protein
VQYRKLIFISTCALLACGACNRRLSGNDYFGGRTSQPGGGSGNSGGSADFGEAIAGTGGVTTTDSPAAGGAKTDGKGGSGRARAGDSAAGRAAGGSGGSDGFDAGSDPLRNRVPAGQVCERLSTIQCAAESACCDGKTFKAFASFNECKQKMKSACTDEMFIDAISTYSVIGYDATYAETAFSEYERMASQCDPNVVGWATSTTGLRGILKGTVAPNRSCYPSALIPTKIDQTAAMLSCADGASYGCLPQGALVWTCAARKSAGNPCFTDINCADGIYCDNPNLAITGATCTSRKPIDSVCQAANECQSLACRDGRCVAADQQAVFCLGP